MIEPFYHHRDHSGKAALDFVRYGQPQHEFLAGRSGLLGRRKDRSEVVARMTKAARRHVAIQKVDVTRKTRVEQRCLIYGSLAAANQCATAWSSVFFELFA